MQRPIQREPFHGLFQQFDGFFTLAVAVVELAQQSVIFRNTGVRFHRGHQYLFGTLCIILLQVQTDLIAHQLRRGPIFPRHRAQHPQRILKVIALQVYAKSIKEIFRLPGLQLRQSFKGRPSTLGIAQLFRALRLESKHPSVLWKQCRPIARILKRGVQRALLKM